jgi:hypothetical protein
MNAFAAAANALFTDMNMSIELGYLRRGLGPLITVRGILSAPTDTLDYAGNSIATDTMRLTVRRSEVAEPDEGDVVILNDEWHVVSGHPQLDILNLTWRLTLIPRDRQ